MKYAVGLHSALTWVCNHCSFRQLVDPHVNHGDPWTRIHLADKFRPGNVPAIFTETIRSALAPAAPPLSANGSESLTQLLLVIDKTYSASGLLGEAFQMLDSLAPPLSFSAFRAVAYTDHDDGDEPFLVRRLGPVDDLRTLLAAVDRLPFGSGRDFDEALEDAMQRCREIVDDAGPQSIVVLTDAGPHPPESCPFEIDFTTEVAAILASGSRIHVASDWLGAGAGAWRGFANEPRFTSGPLHDFIASNRQ